MILSSLIPGPAQPCSACSWPGPASSSARTPAARSGREVLPGTDPLQEEPGCESAPSSVILDTVRELEGLDEVLGQEGLPGEPEEVGGRGRVNRTSWGRVAGGCDKMGRMG